MSNTTELGFDPANPLPTLAKLSVLYGGALLLARLLAAHARAQGALDDDEFTRIQAQCLFQLKNTDTLGLPMQDEALAISQALQQLEQVFAGIR